MKQIASINWMELLAEKYKDKTLGFIVITGEIVKVDTYFALEELFLEKDDDYDGDNRWVDEYSIWDEYTFILSKKDKKRWSRICLKNTLKGDVFIAVYENGKFLEDNT